VSPRGILSAVGRVGHRRAPHRLDADGKAQAVTRATVLIIGATSDIGARRIAPAAPGRPAP